MTGFVKFFHRAKGHGFLVTEDGTEYYVHADDLKEPHLVLKGVRVEFNPCEGAKSPRARNVMAMRA